MAAHPAPVPIGAPAPLAPRTLVLGLSLGQLISWGSVFYGFALFMGPVERSLGLSRAEASLAFSLALLAEGLAALQVGRWIDRGHERAVMTAGSLLLAAALAAQGLVQSRAGFYAVWLALGLGLSATLYPPAFAVVTRRFAHDFRRAIITITFLGGLASTVFIPLTDALIRVLGWRHASWALAALHLGLCAPLHAWLLRGAPRATGAGADADAGAGAGTAAGTGAGATTVTVTAADLGAGAATPGATGAPAASASPGHDGGADAGLRAHLRGPVFWRLGVFTVLLMAVTAAVPAHLVSLLRESGLPPAWAIWLPASIGVLQVAGRLGLYLGERRLDVHAVNRWVPVAVLAGLAALLAGLLLGRGQAAAALLFVALFGVGNGMLTIVKGTAVAQYVSRRHVGALNGALGLPQALARAGLPLAVGLLWSPARGYAWGIALLLAASLVGVGMLWWAQRLAWDGAGGA